MDVKGYFRDSEGFSVAAVKDFLLAYADGKQVSREMENAAITTGSERSCRDRQRISFSKQQ
ncbi:UNVERIFIED_CONTAM: hypothetical protein Sradi_6539900 [Sesamum radiatum]|uniref:Uncharacterized protein n=1 Tax=Sesamum radiatum TaxID=300843 RepID=A0AAW2JW29_SESRA